MKNLAKLLAVSVVTLFAVGAADAKVTRAQLLGKWRGTMSVSMTWAGKTEHKTAKLRMEFKAPNVVVVVTDKKTDAGTFVIVNGVVYFYDAKKKDKNGKPKLKLIFNGSVRGDKLSGTLTAADVAKNSGIKLSITLSVTRVR